MEKNESFYQVISIVIIILIAIGYNLIDENYWKPKEEQQQKQELIDYWTKPTINFFSKFNCKEIKQNLRKVNIDKFVVVETPATARILSRGFCKAIEIVEIDQELKQWQ